jgi:hypothetical protein
LTAGSLNIDSGITFDPGIFSSANTSTTFIAFGGSITSGSLSYGGAVGQTLTTTGTTSWP